MPNAILQFEQMFELPMKRFDTCLAPRVEPSSAARPEELFPLDAQAAMMLANPRFAAARLSWSLGIGPRIFRAQQASSGALVPLPFHHLAHHIAVVARIKQHIH